MKGRLDNALARLADSGVQVHFVTWARIAFEGLLVGGPVAMGLLSFPTFAGLAWAGKGLVWAAGSAIAGWAGTKGCGWLLTRRRRTIDVEHSEDVSASLRALHAAVREGDDAPATRTHLLSCVTRTTGRVAPHGDAELFACLLRPEGTELVLCEYSKFRQGRVPSARIPLDAKDGAAKAYRDRKMNYVPDTSHAEEPATFDGKRYRCILSFPLIEGDVCVGVVSVDSTAPHHFDGHLEDIATHVRPFIEALHLHVMLAGRSSRRRSKVAR